MWSAWNPVAKYGMHPDSYNLDTTVLHEWSGDVYFQSQTEKLIKEWLDEATLKTDQLVDQYWEQISKVAQALLEEEVLSEAQFNRTVKVEQVLFFEALINRYPIINAHFADQLAN